MDRDPKRDRAGSSESGGGDGSIGGPKSNCKRDDYKVWMFRSAVYANSVRTLNERSLCSFTFALR